MIGNRIEVDSPVPGRLPLAFGPLGFEGLPPLPPGRLGVPPPGLGGVPPPPPGGVGRLGEVDDSTVVVSGLPGRLGFSEVDDVSVDDSVVEVDVESAGLSVVVSSVVAAGVSVVVSTVVDSEFFSVVVGSVVVASGCHWLVISIGLASS